VRTWTAILGLAGIAQAELAIEEVWPESIYYRPGQKARIEVRVANPGRTGASAQLAIELVHDLDDAVCLRTDDMSVAANWYDQFAWAPSDMDDLTPDGDRWWSGQTQYNMSKRNMCAIYREMKRNGVHLASYAKAGGGGHATLEFFRRRPELALYTNALPVMGNCDAAFMDFVEALGPPKPGEHRMVPALPEEMAKAGYQGAAWFKPFVKKQCVGVGYTGNGEVFWDQVVLELVEPWTAGRLAQHYAALAAPASLLPVRRDSFRVLLARGL